MSVIDVVSKIRFGFRRCGQQELDLGATATQQRCEFDTSLPSDGVAIEHDANLSAFEKVST